jgi:hypothetical protein
MPLLRTRSLAIAAVICALLALLIVVLCKVPLLFDKVPSAHTVSRSASESKARGLWIGSFVAFPAKLSTPKQTVHINAAWLESRSHRTERLCGTSERSLGGYSLCFTLAESSLDHDYFFVADDSGAGVAENGGTIYTTDVREPSDIANLRLSLVSSWHDPRPKNIRFIPKT